MGNSARRPWSAAAVSAVAVFLAAIVVATLAVTLHMRSSITSARDDLAATAAAAGDLPQGRITPQAIQAFLGAIPEPARLIGRFGQDVATTGPEQGLWDRGSAGWLAGIATVGTAGTVLDGAIEVRRDLASNRALVLRRDVGQGVTGASGSVALLAGAGALLLALAVGLAMFLRERRRVSRVAAFTAAVEGVAAGRTLPPDALPADGDLARAASALRISAERLAMLGEIADRELALLAAAIEPLPVGVGGRGPAGGRMRNLALERLLDGLPRDDRDAIESALAEGLDATDPVGGRARLSDGRIFEVDAWTVPGGRLVSVAERTEQDRLATLRRQLEGAAARQLRAPIDEIRSRGSELYTHVPAAAAATLRSILSATDRLDRVVRMMLRGTTHDPALKPPRRETFGVAGFLWGLAHDWDAALRQRALRVELEIAADLPDVRTDPALVEEILTELVDNAAKFTPRGGTIQMSAGSRDGILVIDVQDTGPGVRPEDAPHAVERFFRGSSSESIPGAGLGLGVASALAERLGGRLVVASGPGGRVQLELPARVDDAAAALAGVS